MHPRNPHQGRYDFDALCDACPELAGFLRPNPKGDRTIDFSDPEAVLCLNRALLSHQYQVHHWAIPQGYLCPPIPGRADYIHHLADLIGVDRSADSRKRIFDIGTGANCIYPILGNRSYGWNFVGTEVELRAFRSARAIVEANPCLQKNIRIVRQKNEGAIFTGILKPSDSFAATMCNPPFHPSPDEARSQNQRKTRNLKRTKIPPKSSNLNFGGQPRELWCVGGEVGFLKRMIAESQKFAGQVGWFTSLVSKSANLPYLRSQLEQAKAAEVKVVPMEQGQKQSRLLAWKF
ncbi:23S rRNA (adenine(1618)-N(6))-methyltransferase RlmF [Puniceicoccus vermicola]|uniref:23S rRNA (Adenine(1618)-N(6))-methyltransferase RlmF n=1 Tax=Puniceicoccus vermicola TaxID=388746 RepID=A0A7X1B0Q2_9BACT|nr:23S rRNA (adenine(1618)-N(6))-methyltransferase RlmF [Puniceicoccus vermicola]MBC2603476.1 23S rRNA (adenine(1618)-N(6))-methyltransferase RlmF [Puniceicoccus vermicola]